MSEKITLKQCLHCGGTAEIKHAPYSVTMGLVLKTLTDISKTSYVECTKCGARSADVEVSNAYSSDQRAAELWNAVAGADTEGDA